MVSISALFEQPDDTADCVIIRGGGNNPRNAKLKTANGLTYLPLSSSTKPFNLHPIAVTIPADRPGTEVYQHDGEEWLHVMSGRVKLSIDGKAMFLNRAIRRILIRACHIGLTHWMARTPEFFWSPARFQSR